MTEKELQEIEDYWADCGAEDDIYRLVAEVRNIKSESEALRKSLTELVRLKQLHDLIESEPSAEFAVAMQDDYDENKPKAWETAFALVDADIRAIGETT